MTIQPSRRKVLAGLAASGAAWAAPSVVRVDSAAASAGSCTDQAVGWTSISGAVGGPYVVTGSAGGVNIQMNVSISTTGTGEVYLSGTQVIWRLSNGHSIGDTMTATYSFTSSFGTVCRANFRVLDLDRNDRGLSCPANSRFHDILTNVTGAGLSVSTEGGIAESPPGSWASTLDCKTTDTENVGLTWDNAAGVSGAGMRWVAAAPHNGSTTLDLQLIKVTPVTVCHTGAGLAARAFGAEELVRTPPNRDVD